jgi:hypothetical protein
MLDRAVRSELTLERIDLIPKDVPTGVQHAPYGGIDLSLEFKITSTQI